MVDDTINAENRTLVALMPQICEDVKQNCVNSSKLSTKIFHVSTLDSFIIRICKILLLNNVMRVYPVVDFFNPRLKLHVKDYHHSHNSLTGLIRLIYLHPHLIGDKTDSSLSSIFTPEDVM